MPRARTKLLCTTLLVGGLGLAMAPFTPSIFVAPAQAQQRVEIRQEFRVALEPHGRFERHARFGEVWRPNRVARDWRPYTVGRWVYTDDWGWYWNSDQAEADWGWVTFHYGRWVDDREMGWIWVPGDQWGPAWVNWRRGEGPAVAARGGRGQGRGPSASADVRYIGWSPLPPDEVVVEYRDNPDVWIFVRARDIVAPRVSTVIIRERRPEILERTVIVNRTVVVRDRGVIVNPGIPPTYVAAFVGRPIVSYEVRPRVIAGTARIDNAIELRVDDLRDRRRLQQERPVIRETRTRIEPVRDVPAPQALQANEQGRLGDRPPRAAAEGAQQRGPAGAAGDRTAPTAPGERPTTTTQDQRDLAPGRTGSTPGQAGTAPGRAGATPGQSGAQPPGQAGTAPGRAGDTPGQAATAPGRQDRTTTDTRTKSDTDTRAKSDTRTGTDTRTNANTRTGTDTRTGSETRSTTSTTAPGRSGAAPGRNDATPGQAGTAPGRAGDTPGQSGAKPPGQAGATPGQSGATPGQLGTAPGRAQQQNREDRSSPSRGAQQREERSQSQQQQRQEKAQEKAQPKAQEKASETRARGETTGATPNRGGDHERAREQRPQQRPDASDPRKEREKQ